MDKIQLPPVRLLPYEYVKTGATFHPVSVLKGDCDSSVTRMTEHPSQSLIFHMPMCATIFVLLIKSRVTGLYCFRDT